MSRSVLTTALERRAFAATRRFEELAAFHVPFEELANRPKTIERRLELVLDRGGRAAVIAASGGGKSSVLSSLLHPPKAMRRLKSDRVKPVLLLEDADGLLGLARVREVAGDGLLASFFGGGLSSVVRDLEVPVLIAVQPAYRDHDSFETFRRDLLDETVALPAPSEFTPDGVDYLVGRALRAAGITASPAAVFDDGALTTLAKVRYAMTTVRQLISVCAQGLAHAEAGGGDVVTEDDVAYGIGQAGIS